MTKLFCMLGWHKMELKSHVDKERNCFSTRRLKYVQCKRCKEVWI